MDLILWRHAEAVDRREGLPELERALTRRGGKQAARIGAWLAARLPDDTRVLSSPALRCQQTVLGLGHRFDVREELGPDRDAGAILAAAGWPRAPHPVLVVGHQPALGAVMARLLAMEGGACDIDKGAVWWLRAREEDGRVRTVLRAVLGAELV